jgi:hypothetical protein
VNNQGQWQTLSAQMPINPVHAALLHTGKVLIVSGSGNLPSDTNYQAAIFDPKTGAISTQPLSWDMFCNGMIVLPDGRVFVDSGTLQYDPFHGQLKSSIYDPATGQFTDAQNMAHGRWYPTVTNLPDGTLMAFSGLDENGNTNSTVEIYTVGSGWSPTYGSPFTPPLYPRMHLIPSGRVFNSGPQTSSYYFDPVAHTWSFVANTNYSGKRTYGTSVLLPMTPANNYKPVVMIMGGGSPSTNTTELIDLSAASPKWVYGPNMSQPRIEMNATILPNSHVLAVGGSLNDEDTATASLNADLYDPGSNTFSSAGQNAFARLYHSNSLLLPDATVLFIGGNPARGTYEPHIEIYSPPYLFNADGTAATRPTISQISSNNIGYGAAFQIQTPNAANISSVVFMRPGAPTHSFDMEQRLVGATFAAGSGVLNVTAPPNSKIAPPGYYMVFLLNAAGVPSVAQFVQLSSTAGDLPPKGTIITPATNVTITAGQSVSFSGSGSDPDGTISAYSWTFPGGNPSSSSLASPGNVLYSATGTYTATLTVADNLNLTDPNPPTRTITVNPAPDFSITASPSSLSTIQGGNVSYNVSVSALNGFTDTVNLAVSGLPSGATATFVPTSISGSGPSTLTVTTAGSSPAGTFTLTITGKTASSLTHSTSATLIVTSAADFALNVSQASVTVGRGGSGADTISVSALKGFTGLVSLSISGVPSRVSASLNPTGISGAGSSRLTIKANKQAPTGSYNVTVTGTSGNLTHTIPLTLTVQ